MVRLPLKGARPGGFVFRIWSRRPDSDRRPAVYKTAALPAELRRRAPRLYEGYEVATVVWAGSSALMVIWLTGTLSLRKVVTKVLRVGSHQVIREVCPGGIFPFKFPL